MMTLEMEYMTREIMGEKRGEERGREKARYSDVSSGLYSPEKGAELLNMSLKDFLKGMEEAGYKLPEGAKYKRSLIPSCGTAIPASISGHFNP